MAYTGKQWPLKRERQVFVAYFPLHDVYRCINSLPKKKEGESMRHLVVVTLTLAFVIAAGIVVAQQQPATPSPWAYGFATPPGPAGANPPAPAAPPAGQGAAAAPDTTQHKLAGSTLSFTAAQIRDGNGPADWFPNDHPAMPEIVAHGRRDAQVIACSLCHYPN